MLKKPDIFNFSNFENALSYCVIFYISINIKFHTSSVDLCLLFKIHGGDRYFTLLHLLNYKHVI